MAAGITQTAVNSYVLGPTLRGSAMPSLASTYHSLFSGTPSDTGGGTELAMTRKAVAQGTGTWDLPAAGGTKNTGVIDFGLAPSNLGTATQWGAFDALTGGNLLLWQDCNSSLIQVGDPFSIAAGALILTLSTGFTQYYADNFIWNPMLRGVAAPTLSNLYASLYSAPPSDTGGGTELAGITRKPIAVSTASWSAPSGGQCSNAGVIDFGSSLSGTVGWFGLFDAVTTGNLLMWAALTSSKTISSQDANFPIGSLIIGAQ